jgi:hypothetical protein
MAGKIAIKLVVRLCHCGLIATVATQATLGPAGKLAPIGEVDVSSSHSSTLPQKA